MRSRGGRVVICDMHVILFVKKKGGKNYYSMKI